MSAQETFKTANVKFFDIYKSPSNNELEEIFSSSEIVSHQIDCINWPQRNNGYKVYCSFKVIYTNTHLYIRYQVKEKALRATFGSDEGAMPWTDDCMELFIIPNSEDGVYFNIEMNCIGYGIVGKGALRTKRDRLDSESLSRIARYSSLGREPFGDKIIADSKECHFEWNMTIAVPLDILCGKAGVQMLRGKSVRANVYKCGDKMVKPHYYSWSPVGTPSPNFHTPEFFGVFNFE